MTTYELDELQTYLKDEGTITDAEDYLHFLNISKKFAKLYLTTHLFIKIPNFFSNVPVDFSNLVTKVYNNENLVENLPLYETMFNKWKKSDCTMLIVELESMKRQTRAASSETEDEQCKQCYKTQEDIIRAAETFFKVKID